MTGTLFAPVLRKLIDRFNARFGMQLEVIAVESSSRLREVELVLGHERPRQLAHDLTVSVAYVGNKGTHLDFDYFNYNAAPLDPAIF